MLSCAVTSTAFAEPLKLLPQNPHYFLYRGKPTVLVTSGEHYGAVVNLDFNYDVYLDTLASAGLNLTRLFVGSYLEKPGDFGIRLNTLAPAAGRVVVPWARSTVAGYAGGGNKFDLDTWDDAYFARMKDFLAKAHARGIAVEVVFFSDWYGRGDYSPLHPSNNVNGLEGVTAATAHTLSNGKLLAYQEALVRKVVRDLNGLENVYFEIQNEPYATSKEERDVIHPYLQPVQLKDPGSFWVNRVDLASAASLAWQRRVAEWIADEQRTLPHRHLVAQNYANFRVPLDDVDRNVSVLNFHYALPEAAAWNRGWSRPLAFDESGFAGSDNTLYRRQAWRFIMAGGAVFSGLDYSFAAGHEKGTAENDAPGAGGPALRSELGVLRKIVESMDLTRLRPDPSVVALAPGAIAHAMSVPGRAYLVYLEGKSETMVTLQLPAGRYLSKWMNTRTGRVERQERVTHSGGTRVLESPEYVTDVVLQVVKL